MSIVTTGDGRVLTGLVLERSPSRVALQTATERIVLAPADVDSIRDSPLSIMPEDQLANLSRNEIRDLIAYLASPVQVAR
jgi:putative heme-binding domain-containing protein